MKSCGSKSPTNYLSISKSPKDYEEITELYSSYIDTAMGIEAQDEFEIQKVTIDKHMQTVRNRISNEQRAARAPIASSTPTSVLPVAVSSDFYRQDKKAKTIPVPTFDGTFADCRSLWHCFSDYYIKLRDVTHDEKLSFLLESLYMIELQI